MPPIGTKSRRRGCPTEATADKRSESVKNTVNQKKLLPANPCGSSFCASQSVLKFRCGRRTFTLRRCARSAFWELRIAAGQAPPPLQVPPLSVREKVSCPLFRLRRRSRRIQSKNPHPAFFAPIFSFLIFPFCFTSLQFFRRKPHFQKILKFTRFFSCYLPFFGAVSSSDMYYLCKILKKFLINT